jgi:hypothetical protein
MMAGGWGRILRMDFMVVVLPQPVSPIKPIFSPWPSSKFTPFSTLSVPSKIL